MTYEPAVTTPRRPGPVSAGVALVIALVFVMRGGPLFALPLFVYAAATAALRVVETTLARVLWGLLAAAAGLVSLALLTMFAMVMTVFANGDI